MIQSLEATPTRPSLYSVPFEYQQDLKDLFDTWDSVRPRNAKLNMYYRMHNKVDDLGISIPPQLTNTNSVVGWADKAVRVVAVRSQFDGFVKGGGTVSELDKLAEQNELTLLYDIVCRSALVYGMGAMTVMAGANGQPRAKVRAFSANQCCCLWDKDKDQIGAGVVLSNVDTQGRPLKYIAHFPHAVLTIERASALDTWMCTEEENPHNTPLMVPFIYDADADRPMGHSRITPEVIGIIDKAMRDVLRMEVGSEFFTAPQRYILGATKDLFAAQTQGAPVPSDDIDDDARTDETIVSDPNKMMQAYLGSFLAITRDDNGDVPQVGQFPAGNADNFIRVFENDAQRFSGATCVPLAQLGVLSNTYTSSDAMSATNDPLILEVEAMNRRNKLALERVARLMLAISEGKTLNEMPEDIYNIKAHLVDPSMPTFSARADGWTKIGTQDKSIIGTRVWYEGMGLQQETIDRIEANKEKQGVLDTLNGIYEQLGEPSLAETGHIQG